jgi:hypothetical protein
MKNLRHLCVAVVLTLSLTLTALADGQMHTGIVDPPPPPPPSADGNIGTGTANTIGTNSEADNPITALAVGLVQSVLSLF